MIATSYRPLGHSGRSGGGRGGQRENVEKVQREGRKGAEEEELEAGKGTSPSRNDRVPRDAKVQGVTLFVSS